MRIPARADRLAVWCLAAACSLPPAPSAAAIPEACQVVAEQDGARFPVEQLDPDTRCRLGAVVNHATTVGAVGPLRTSIPPSLYEFLLDRPVLIAALGHRLGLGHYQFTAKGPDQFWGDDGEGTQGLLSLVQRTGSSRIYHIDGYHEGHVFPMVKARAVVFVNVLPVTASDGSVSVDTSLRAYTRLNDPVLSGLLWMLRPLISETVTQKLAQAFEVTTQVGNALAADFRRILQDLAALPFSDRQEQHAFIEHLQKLSERRGGPPAALPRATP